ncbi:peptidoglycan-binding domain-containing protein [Microbacterium sp. P5_E9]
MRTESSRMPGLRAAAIVLVTLAAVGLAGCSDSSGVDRAKAQVTAKEKALTQAEADFTAASGAFCDASKDYIVALDGYGDVITATAPTVGDVTAAGADLAKPGKGAFDSAEAAVDAQQALTVAQQELVDAQAALARAEAGPSGSPSVVATEVPSATPLAPAATVDRVEQAEADFDAAQGAITDETPLAEASEHFNSAAVALEMAWLRLFADAGCVPDEQKQQAEAAVRAYTTALQTDLATAGRYTDPVDGVYGPATVAAVEGLQEANGLPVTGTVDKATAAALQGELLALGGAATQEALATTAAVQQTLKLVGFWDGPVDGTWTPELTEALMAFQTELGVEPTGVVDAATIAAFEKAIADLTAPASPSPEPSASATP